MAANISAYITEAVERLAPGDSETLPDRRYAKFRRIGVFAE
jgi:acetyl-CoA carboxylase alpha subunit